MSFAEKLSGAISNLDINSVFLSEANVKLGTHPANIRADNTVVDVEDQATWKLNKNEDLLICQVRRVLKGTQSETGEEKDSKEVLLIIASFVVQYTILDPSKKAEDHTYEVFAKTNAVYNSYPYFREFIHSISTRAGVQPIVMSFLKPYTMKQILEAFPEPTAEETNSP